MQKIVVYSDQQCRYIDWQTHKAVMKWQRDFDPDLVCINGDTFDLEALGKYRKSFEARQSVMADIEAGRLYAKDVRNHAKHAEMYFDEGNHEDRWNRYILDVAPELREALGTFWEFSGLAEFDIKYAGGWGEGIHWGDLFVYHGSKISPHSAYSARAEIAQEGGSGVSGHTHRLGTHYVTDRRGTHVWMENGCLCNVEGDMIPPRFKGPHVLNWQQGFSFGYRDDSNDVWTMYQIPIIDHKFIWDGYVYRP